MHLLRPIPLLQHHSYPRLHDCPGATIGQAPQLARCHDRPGATISPSRGPGSWTCCSKRSYLSSCGRDLLSRPSATCGPASGLGPGACLPKDPTCPQVTATHPFVMAKRWAHQQDHVHRPATPKDPTCPHTAVSTPHTGTTLGPVSVSCCVTGLSLSSCSSY